MEERNAVEENSPIQDEYSKVATAITRVFDSFNSLADKIGSTLCDPATTEPRPEAVTNTTCEAGRRLREFTTELNEIGDHIQEITNRCQL